MLILAGAQISEHLGASWVPTEDSEIQERNARLLSRLSGPQYPGIDPGKLMCDWWPALVRKARMKMLGCSFRVW